MAQVGVAYETANPFEIDSNGVPLAGGQLFSYVYGTTTPLATYQDPLLTTPNANPIVADANGRFGSVWLQPSISYLFQLFSAATPDNPSGVEIWSRGPYGPAAGGIPATSAGIIGEIRAFAGPQSQIPPLWYYCAGQALSRTTYAASFAVLGTTWGAGDGVTTFNIPDLRGRTMAGLDNMGGFPANRITSGVSGISGVTLGAAGGDQNEAPDNTLSASSSSTSSTSGAFVAVNNGSIGVLGGANKITVQGVGSTQNYAVQGEVISTVTTTTVTSDLTGGSANVQPTAMVFLIIYLGQ